MLSSTALFLSLSLRLAQPRASLCPVRPCSLFSLSWTEYLEQVTYLIRLPCPPYSSQTSLSSVNAIVANKHPSLHTPPPRRPLLLASSYSASSNSRCCSRRANTNHTPLLSAHATLPGTLDSGLFDYYFTTCLLLAWTWTSTPSAHLPIFLIYPPLASPLLRPLPSFPSLPLPPTIWTAPPPTFPPRQDCLRPILATLVATLIPKLHLQTTLPPHRNPTLLLPRTPLLLQLPILPPQPRPPPSTASTLRLPGPPLPTRITSNSSAPTILPRLLPPAAWPNQTVRQCPRQMHDTINPPVSILTPKCL